MDRIALAKRLEGLSKVFASNTPYHRELKAMAEVLSSADDEKFQAVLSADFSLEDKEAIVAPWAEPQKNLMQDRQDRADRIKGLPGGILTEEALKRNISRIVAENAKNPGFMAALKDLVKKMTQGPSTMEEAPVTPGVSAPAPVTAPASAEASDDKDAIVAPWAEPQKNLMQDRQDRADRIKGIPGGILTDEALIKNFDRIVAENAKNPGFMAALKDIVQKMTKGPSTMEQVPVAPGAAKPAPVKAPMSAEASDSEVGMFWTREASDAILSNLLRDVVGMDKKQVEDTGRKLDKDQIPNGTHDGEKAKTLTPEQTPEQKDVLDSGMVEKSHGKVRKEAAEEKDEKDSCDEKKEAAEDGVKNVAKEKKEEREQETMKKTVEELAKAKKDSDKEANVFEGIELGSPMEDVTIDAAEADKLSKLFV